ncbi:MAG: hypothetical protein CMN78_04485 [Spirochaetales bacterium]|nr:hypothetical protein [Spirochaetales bacterium]
MKELIMKIMLRLMPRKMRIRMMMKRPLLHLVLTDKDEYSCEEAYEVLDAYADMSAKGEDVKKLMPLVKLHLDLCANCREEFQILLKVITSA